MNIQTLFSHKRLLVSFLLLTQSQTLLALDWSATASADSRHTNNSLRTAENEQSDLLTTLNAEFTLEENRETVQADLRYDVSSVDFKDDTQGDATTVEGDGSLTWSPLPNRFQWDLTNSIRSIQRDNRQANILNNQEERSITSTGPLITTPLSKVDQLSIRARYTMISFEDTDINDNDRGTITLDLQHRLSNTHSISAGIEYTEVEFDDNQEADIETSVAFLTYRSQLSNSEIMLKAGYNESERSNNQKTNAPLYEASYNYNTSGHRVDFTAINLITDSTMGVGNNPTALDNDTPPNDTNFNVIDIVERTFSRLTYTNTLICTRCTLALTLSYDSQDFDAELRDEKNTLLRVDYSYRLSQNLTASIYAFRQNREFGDVDREDDLDRISLRLNYAVQERYNTFIFFSSRDNNSNNAEFDYNELRAGVGIRVLFQ